MSQKERGGEVSYEKRGKEGRERGSSQVEEGSERETDRRKRRENEIKTQRYLYVIIKQRKNEENKTKTTERQTAGVSHHPHTHTHTMHRQTSVVIRTHAYYNNTMFIPQCFMLECIAHTMPLQ